MNRNQRRLQAKATPAAAIVQAFNLAVGHHREGRFGEAEAIYRRILEVDTRHADSLNLLGLIAHQTGRNNAAVELIGKAISIKRTVASYHSNLGLALRDLGRTGEALAAYDTALRVQPDYAEAHTNRGVILKRLGRLEEALAAYDGAVRSRPDFAIAHVNRGLLLRDLGRPAEALDAFDAALRVRPDHAEALLNRGVILKELGRLDEALAACDALLRLRPNLAEAHLNRGNALMGFARQGEALEAYDAALRLRPDFAIAHADRGQALAELGRLQDALAAYGDAIRQDPDYPDAHLNRGGVLKDLGRIAEALDAYDAALRIKPDYAEAYSNRLLALHYSETVANKAILDTANRFGVRFGRDAAPVTARGAGHRDRLRIGYVSGDLRRHPVGYFIETVLAHHDRAAVEVFCYDTGGRGDDLSDRLRASVDHWVRLVGLDDATAAAAIRADAIDVLIDLSGHTALNRLPMFAHKPAPVQVSWLGYFGTTGLKAMDYVLADRFVAPEGSEGDFVEKVWRLPGSYLCFTPPDLNVAAEAAPGARPLTFGSFNNHTKTSPRTIALWADVLERVPGSRLQLKTKALGDETARTDLIERFAAHGIAADRLVLEGAAPRAELLAAYNRIDVALDPTPYGGGTTTAEALWMGVPVVSLRGGTWVGRVSESILATVGLGDLVAADEAGYVAIAAALAADAQRRSGLRRDLRGMLEGSPLCDAAAFTRQLETAFREMARSQL